MLLELCRRLEVGPAEILYVGDTSMDAEMARNAGAPFAYAAYGYGPARVWPSFPRVASLSSAGEIAGLMEVKSEE